MVDLEPQALDLAQDDHALRQEIVSLKQRVSKLEQDLEEVLKQQILDMDLSFEEKVKSLEAEVYKWGQITHYFQSLIETGLTDFVANLRNRPPPQLPTDPPVL